MSTSSRDASPRATRHLTANEFEAVRPLMTKLSGERQESARLCLVEGKSMSAVAEQAGVSRQTIHAAVERVWSMVDRYRASLRYLSGDPMGNGAELPPGWEVVSLVAPRHLIEEFRRRIAEEISSKSPGASL